MGDLNKCIIHMVSKTVHHTVNFELLPLSSKKASRYNVPGMFQWVIDAVRMTRSTWYCTHPLTCIQWSLQLKTDTSCDKLRFIPQDLS